MVALEGTGLLVEKRRVEFRCFKVKFLRNWTEIGEKLLQRPFLKLNSNLFRPANLANPSSFGQVMKMPQKCESASDVLNPNSSETGLKLEKNCFKDPF